MFIKSDYEVRKVKKGRIIEHGGKRHSLSKFVPVHVIDHNGSRWSLAWSDCHGFAGIYVELLGDGLYRSADYII